MKQPNSGRLSQFFSRSRLNDKHLSHQQGFTLIELMVVVVIVAVVVSVGILSLGRVNQDLASVQKAKVESFLKQVADEAAFKQSLLLVAPDEKGLNLYIKKNFQWQSYSGLETIQWHENFHVDWNLDANLVRQFKLPASGWLMWPSGEVTPGEIRMESKSEDEAQWVVLRWDQGMVFSGTEE